MNRNSCLQRNLFRRENTRQRYGLSLIEIMMSIMVLSIGLLGVLAAIPFGGYQMEQMRDADFTSVVARNAFAVIEANEWHIPSQRSWFRPDLERNNNTSLLYIETVGTKTSGYMDFTFPILIDPMGEQLANGTVNANPYIYRYPNNNNGIGYYYQIYPRKTNFDTMEVEYYNNPTGYIDYFLSGNGIDYYFRTHDDIVYATPEHEGKTVFRPIVNREDINTIETNSTWRFNTIPEKKNTFTGQYSWMAMMRPKITDALFQNCKVYPENSVQETEVDVVVYKGRTEAEPYIFTAYKMDNALGGGSFFLQVNNNDTGNLIDLLEYLKTTKYLLIHGDNPMEFYYNSSNNIVYRRFARWYQVANYSKVYNDSNYGEGIQVTLVGPDCPNAVNWGTNSNNAFAVKALVFPNVSGVYTRTMSIKQQ